MLAPTPEVHGELESDGLEDLLVRPVKDALKSALALAGKYLEVQAGRQSGATSARLDERELWVVATLHAFVLQLAGALRRLTHAGRLRPFGVALAQRKVVIGELRYEGFQARGPEGPASDLKPVKLADIVGNQDYLQAGLRLARDVAAYDLKAMRGPKQLNPVLFGLGRPGCGKTITAHAIGNYFLDFCKQRDVPARFKVIRRTDWASSYQNASAATLSPSGQPVPPDVLSACATAAGDGAPAAGAALGSTFSTGAGRSASSPGFGSSIQRTTSPSE